VAGSAGKSARYRNRPPGRWRLTGMACRDRPTGGVLAAVSMVVVAVLAAGCGSASGGGGLASPAASLRASAAPLTSAGRPRPQFVSLRFAPKRLRGSGPAGFLEVALSDSRTGAIFRRLLPASSDGMQVTGLSLDQPGNLWITYSRGPSYRNGTAGGDPRPDSCANEVAILHAATGRVTVYLRTRNNVLISRAAPSPDGRVLAYRESGCATGYLNSYLRVTELSTGRSWTLGEGLPRCHLISDPSWSTNGQALLAGYAPAAAPAYTGPQGTCRPPLRERLVTLSPAAPQAGLDGGSAGADPGCQITSVAGIAGGGALAIEACGRRTYLSGPARLLILSARLRQVRQITLGHCTDGNELDADRSGRSVLVSAYLYCNPPARPGPVTRLWRYQGGILRRITTVPGDTSGVSVMTW
jgi:hypothetical protein